MSIEIIVTLSILGAGVVLGLMWYGHNQEKERATKALLVANLNERAHRLQRLLDTIPAAYVEKDVKLLILSQIKARVEKLTELVPTNEKFRKSLEGLTAQINETQASTSQPPIPQLKTAEEAKEVKNRLQDLTKVIESFVANKTIQVGTAKKYLGNIHKLFIDANISFNIQVADQSRRDNKTKLAIHQYQKAIAELTKHNQNNTYTDKIAQLKEIVTSLSGKPDAVEADSGGDALTQGMSELDSEDDAWKKKYF